MAQFQMPPLDVEGMVYDRPAWATKGASFLASIPWGEPVRVASPCVGLNAPHRSAMELQCPWQSVDMFDVNPVLRGALAELLPGAEVHCGRAEGDITRVPLEQLCACDGLVSGPPCPPPSPASASVGSETTHEVLSFFGSWTGSPWGRSES